jgi:hypothetical protein
VIVLAPRSFDAGSRAPENPFDLTGLEGALLVVDQVTFAATNLAVVVGAGSLVVRFRRARGTERRQLQWVALAAVLTVLGPLAILAAFAVGASPALLGGGYAVVVLGLGQLLGRDSSLAVAGATLAVAGPVPAGPAAGSRRPSTGVSTGAATTPRPPSRRSAAGGTSRSTWALSRPSCWPWSTRRCSRPRAWLWLRSSVTTPTARR